MLKAPVMSVCVLWTVLAGNTDGSTHWSLRKTQESSARLVLSVSVMSATCSLVMPHSMIDEHYTLSPVGTLCVCHVCYMFTCNASQHDRWTLHTVWSHRSILLKLLCNGVCEVLFFVSLVSSTPQTSSSTSTSGSSTSTSGPSTSTSIGTKYNKTVICKWMYIWKCSVHSLQYQQYSSESVVDMNIAMRSTEHWWKYVDFCRRQ